MNRDELNAARKALDAERAIYRAKNGGAKDTEASKVKTFPFGSDSRVAVDTATVGPSHPLFGTGDRYTPGPDDSNFSIDLRFLAPSIVTHVAAALES